MERAEIIPNQPMEFSQQLPTPSHPIDCQNCNFYLTEIGAGGMGMWWNIPVSREWFSDRFFAASGGCYQPGDTVGDTKDI
jgi:hypothetical protein